MPPVLIQPSERPPLVIAALRWVSECAAAHPVSERDEAMRKVGHIDYLVPSEVALAMLDEAGGQSDPWDAMPHIRALDAAVLVSGEKPTPGIQYREQLTPAQQAVAQLIEGETGCHVPSRWQPIRDGSDWITQAQFRAMREVIGPQTEASPERQVPLTEARQRAILAAMERLGIDPLHMPKQQPGRSGTKAEVRTAATKSGAFGKAKKAQQYAFDNTWKSMLKSGDLRKAP